MKCSVIVSIVLLGLAVSCVPAVAPQPQIALATVTLQAMMATATAMPSDTSTPMETTSPTATATFTSTPTVTPSPKPTATPTPAITPLALSSITNIDISTIPEKVFGKSNYWETVGGIVFSNAGVIGKDTIFERLTSYPGFEGAVVHVDLRSPSPNPQDNQRAYVEVDSSHNVFIGIPWAFELSQLVLRAPSRLVNTGWKLDPLIMLATAGYHPNNDPSNFKTYGGVNLITNDGSNYYVSLYRVNLDGSVLASDQKVPFKIGVKQIVRIEVFYDGPNNVSPSIRAFIVEPTNGASGKYSFIGKLHLDPQHGDTIFGFKGLVGVYSGQPVIGYEGVSGEVKIYR